MEQLLAETNNSDFQQLQQELLQQSTQEQNHQLDQQLNFALQQSQYQTDSQQMDLLMGGDVHQSHQTNSAMQQSRGDDGTSLTANSMSASQISMSNQMQAEMDQMLDIDFMQVLKCFESAPAGENLGDLAGGLSLFNDMDVMNIGLDDVVSTATQSRESKTQEMMAEIEKKREKMIRECDMMMRRLRKMQARHMGRHVSEEVGGLFEYTQQLIKRKERETKSISTMTPINQLHSDKHKLNSTTSWRMLLKRIEHAATSQHSNASSSKWPGNTAFGDQHHANNTAASMLGSMNTSPTVSSTSPSSSVAKPSVITCVPQFDQNGIQQLQQCSGLLSAQLKLAGKSFDSDATER